MKLLELFAGTRSMVNRIVENERYCGGQDYPAIVDRQEYISAKQTKSGKYAGTGCTYQARFFEYLDGKSVEQIRQGFDSDSIASPVSKKRMVARGSQK